MLADFIICSKKFLGLCFIQKCPKKNGELCSALTHLSLFHAQEALILCTRPV